MCTEAPLLVRLTRLQMALSAHLQALPQVWMILWLISFLRSERAGRVGSQRLPWCLSLHKLRETCAVTHRVYVCAIYCRDVFIICRCGGGGETPTAMCGAILPTRLGLSDRLL